MHIFTQNNALMLLRNMSGISIDVTNNASVISPEVINNVTLCTTFTTSHHLFLLSFFAVSYVYNFDLHPSFRCCYYLQSIGEINEWYHFGIP